MTSDSPFAPSCSRPSFLETAGAAEALRRLDAGLGAREPFLLLTGEPGTGKTTVAHEMIARWESRVAAAFLAHPALRGAELLEEIVLRFGGQPADGASRPRLMSCLEQVLGGVAAKGQVAMVVVDDAHRLTPESLEELDLLVKAAQQVHLQFEVLLIGLPALESLVEDPALRERISVRARLGPLSAGETRRYLRHRVAVSGADGAALFPRKICIEIAELSGGVPRRINALAAEALRLAQAAGVPEVRSEQLRAATDALRGVASPHPITEPDDAEAEEPAPPAGAPRAAAEGAAPITAGSAKAAAPAPGRSAPALGAEPVARTPAKPAAPAAAPAARPPASAAPAPASRERPLQRPAGPAWEESDPPRPAPASHDPSEWVSRFGPPVRIGVAAMAETGWTPLLEPAAEGSGEATPRPPARRRPVARSRPGSRRSRRGGSRGITVGLTVLAASVALLIVVRAGRFSGTRPGRGSVVVASAPAPRPADAAVAPVPGAAVAPHVEAGPAPGDSSRAAAAAPNPRRRYTLDLGQFIDLQAALDERDRVQSATGMQAWVVPAADSTGVHHIVLGAFRSEERAAAAAQKLIESQTLPAASVVLLPKRSARR